MRPAIETKWVRCRTPAGELVFAARPELRERLKKFREVQTASVLDSELDD